MYTKAFPYIFVLSLFWGTNIVASRFGVGEFNAFFFVALRLAIATAAFALVQLVRNRQWSRDPAVWGHAMVSGLLGVAVPMTCFIVSLQYQSSGVASIYVTMAPALIVVAAHFVLPDEKMTRNKLIGLGLALAGSLFLALRGESGLADIGRANPLGFILVLTGLSVETINTMFVRLRMQEMDTQEVTGIRLLTGAVIVLVGTPLLGEFTFEGVTAAGYFSLAYAALIGALAGQFMAFHIMRTFGATAFSLTSYLIPVVATTFGVLILGEIVTWGMGVGVLLIGSGIYLINRRQYHERPVSTTAD